MELENGFSRLRIAFEHAMEERDPRPPQSSIYCGQCNACKMRVFLGRRCKEPEAERRLGTTAWQTLTCHGSNLGCWQIAQRASSPKARDEPGCAGKTAAPYRTGLLTKWGCVGGAANTSARCWGVAFVSRLGKLCFDGKEESRGVSRTRRSGSTVDVWRRSAAASGGGGRSDALGVLAGRRRK